MTTIIFPLISALDAICSAAYVAAPEDMPARMPSSFANRLVVATAVSSNLNNFIDQVKPEYFRNEPCTDSLDPVRPRTSAAEHWRFGRFDCYRFESRFPFFENTGNTCNGPTSSHACYNHIHLAVSIFPYFLGSRPAVDFRVCRVPELLGYEVERWIFCSHLFCFTDCTSHSFSSGCQDELCS